MLVNINADSHFLFGSHPKDNIFFSSCRYCNQVLSKEIDESVTLLLQELVRFQERVYQKDPTKAKSKRRLVMGLREVTKHMKLHKIKCVIISPNCEKIQAKGKEVLQECLQHQSIFDQFIIHICFIGIMASLHNFFYFFHFFQILYI